MPTFSSLDALMDYVNSATSNSMKEVGDELKTVMKDAIDDEVYGQYSPNVYKRTEQLKDMVELTNVGNNSAEVRVTHTGGHMSYVKGTRFYVPYGLEGGHTWGRGATDIEGDAIKKAEDRIPNVYKESMRSKGIPIK